MMEKFVFKEDIFLVSNQKFTTKHVKFVENFWFC